MAGTWKPQNFRRVPSHLRSQIENLGQDEFILYNTRRVSLSDATSGQWGHLGIGISGGQVQVPAEVLPASAAGDAARMNREGKERKRTDLPKVTKTYSTETPNFGDWSKGSHTVYFDRLVYPVEFIAPDGLAIRMNVLNTLSDGTAEIAFDVGRVFDRTTALGDQAPLLRAANLLQESTGRVRVRGTQESIQAFVDSIHVEWEILPVGDLGESVEIVATKLNASPVERALIQERMDFLIARKPEALISGQSGFARYFGAKFADDCIVFENIRYGNALYVMYENWQDLSQRTRLELLAQDPADQEFDRIVHSGDWRGRLSALLTDRLGPLH